MPIRRWDINRNYAWFQPDSEQELALHETLIKTRDIQLVHVGIFVQSRRELRRIQRSVERYTPVEA